MTKTARTTLISSFVPVIALTAALVAPACTCARPPKGGPEHTAAQTKDAVTTSATPTTTTTTMPVPIAARGMWVWGTAKRLEEPQGISELLATCRLAHLNEVYLSVNEQVLAQPRLLELLTGLRDAGVRAEALMGDAGWYEPAERAVMFRLIDAVGAYNQRNGGARFAAIHLDIEPHQLPQNHGKTHAFLPALAATLREATTHAARLGMTTSADLPRFALEEDGPELATAVSRPFVMLYELRDKSAQHLVAASGAVLDNAYASLPPAQQARLVVGLLVEDYPSNLQISLDALDRAHTGRAHYGGWAIHDEASFHRLVAHVP